MTLASGTHVGPYEITDAIGAGGMGEVYRARDPKLDRDVAVKVLPEAFARDADRMARFQREAKVLASLDHPNIASIYGLEDSSSTRALVMQLVEGPTLADRIKSGPIPVDEAVRIARQIADALEYAHERGIIHRDLKPANVKLTNDDVVKVLDFGLAKALEGAPSSIDISTSPTISRMATQQGVLLGTAAYMSPEQAKGKSVDRRADIWAFGCVLYEMLTGKQTFTGETVTDTLAAVIMRNPDLSDVPGRFSPVGALWDFVAPENGSVTEWGARALARRPPVGFCRGGRRQRDTDLDTPAGLARSPAPHRNGITRVSSIFLVSGQPVHRV